MWCNHLRSPAPPQALARTHTHTAFLRAAAPRPSAAWTVEESARFAALRDFQLLQLLSRDRKALSAARRLGAFHQPHSGSSATTAGNTGARHGAPVDAALTTTQPSCGGQQQAARHARPTRRPHPQPQPHPPSVAVAVVARHGASAAPPPRERPAGDSSTAVGNARQRRSAARSALRHAARRRMIRSQVLATLFVIRLRRRVRLRRGLEELEELADSDPAGEAVKRGRPSSRSDSEISNPSSFGDALEYEHHHVMGVVRTSTRAPPTKRVGLGVWHAGPALR